MPEGCVPFRAELCFVGHVAYKYIRDELKGGEREGTGTIGGEGEGTGTIGGEREGTGTTGGEGEGC